ncbi:MAG: cobalamin biosynthesis protein [Rhodobacteraceae bacterium]|nr:cobalamin biosynthesis protein [Paracoccaceae bacterium]
MKIAGFGFRGEATADSLSDALAATGQCVAGFAAPSDKADAPALVALAARYHVPVHAIDPQALTDQSTTTQSAASQAHRSTGSVAEACALAAAGARARLVTARQISQDRMATCAVAEGPDP